MKTTHVDVVGVDVVCVRLTVSSVKYHSGMVVWEENSSVSLGVCIGLNYHLLKCSIGGSCRVTLVVAFGFLTQILGDCRDLRMVLCHSMNASGVVGALKPYPFHLNFLHSQTVG